MGRETHELCVAIENHLVENPSALRAVIAAASSGAEKAIARLHTELNIKDRAFLSALVLSESKRVDKKTRDACYDSIASAINVGVASDIERRALAKAPSKSPTPSNGGGQ